MTDKNQKAPNKKEEEKQVLFRLSTPTGSWERLEGFEFVPERKKRA